MDWSVCSEIEQVDGKVSSKPVIKATRVFADAIPENYQAALDHGYTPDEAVAETHEKFFNRIGLRD